MWPSGRLSSRAVLAAVFILAAPIMLADATFLRHIGAAGGQAYTQNVACREKYCINPVIPGLSQFGKNILDENSNKTWSCVDTPAEWHRNDFCGPVISGYHFAVPDQASGRKAMSVDEQVRQQSGDAISAYVAHLSGMGHDFWDYPKPWLLEDDCIKAVWKMVCYTHFPQCNKVTPGEYLRPCASSCQDYLATCQVQCCDEGVQCVFQHNKVQNDGTSYLEEGYVPHAGPSPLCTGAAHRRDGHPLGSVLAMVSILTALVSGPRSPSLFGR